MTFDSGDKKAEPLSRMPVLAQEIIAGVLPSRLPASNYEVSLDY